ncbi:hypothetical protein GCM10027429_11180 [Marivirga atlantica]|jgi:PBP1b-binding outer membrane lipoprotein LpoB
MKMTKTYLLALLVFLSIIACSTKKDEDKALVTESKVEVINLDNRDSYTMEYVKQLDSIHQNLLDPSKSKEQYDAVLKAWQDYHTGLGEILNKSELTSDDTAETTLKIFHRIYFKADGQVKTHLFKVLSPELSDSIKNQFTNKIATFDSDFDMPLERINDYAQCGKAAYLIN